MSKVDFTVNGARHVVEADDDLDHLPEEGSSESHIDDPIRMYLMQMGEIPMLNRADEISSARSIEETRKVFRNLMLGNDFVLQGAVELLEKVQKGELRRLGEFAESQAQSQTAQQAGLSGISV